MTQPSNQDSSNSDVNDVGTGRGDRIREMLSDRRILVLLGALALGIVALFAFVVVPSLTKSSDDSVASTPVRHAIGLRTATPTASASVAPLPTVNDAFKVRDPFKPLYVVPAAAASNAGASSPAVTTTPVATAPAGTVAAAATPTPSPSTVELIQLTLVKINPNPVPANSTADVTVNGVPYSVKVNQPFGAGFTMKALTSTNATFTYGGQTVTLVPHEFGLFATA